MIRIDHIIGAIVTASAKGEKAGIQCLADCLRHGSAYEGNTDAQKLADILDQHENRSSLSKNPREQ